MAATEEGKDPPSEQLPPRRADGINTNLVSHISNMAFKLALSEDEHSVCTTLSTILGLLHLKNGVQDLY